MVCKEKGRQLVTGDRLPKKPGANSDISHNDPGEKNNRTFFVSNKKL